MNKAAIEIDMNNLTLIISVLKMVSCGAEYQMEEFIRCSVI